jgi:hypothetical protein
MLLVGFIGSLQYWGSLYELRRVSDWDVFKIGVVLLPALIFCIATQVIIPDSNNFNYDYQKYFAENASVLYGLIACVVVTLSLEKYFMKRSFPLKYYVVMMLYFLLCVSAVIVNSQQYKDTLPFILLPLQIYNMYAIRIKISDNPA